MQATLFRACAVAPKRLRRFAHTQNAVIWLPRLAGAGQQRIVQNGDLAWGWFGPGADGGRALGGARPCFSRLDGDVVVGGRGVGCGHFSGDRGGLETLDDQPHAGRGAAPAAGRGAARARDARELGVEGKARPGAVDRRGVCATAASTNSTPGIRTWRSSSVWVWLTEPREARLGQRADSAKSAPAIGEQQHTRHYGSIRPSKW
jgi:hypothetical protein